MYRGIANVALQYSERMQSVLSYNETEVKRGGSKDDIRQNLDAIYSRVAASDIHIEYLRNERP